MTFGDVVTIHGVCTTEEDSWQKDSLLGGLIGRLFNHRDFYYGYVSYFPDLVFLRPIAEIQRVLQSQYTLWDQIAVDFNKYCQSLPVQRPSVIAHSFGTYILYTALKKYSGLKFDRVILCGSPIDSNLDWSPLSNQVNQVWNYHSPEDKIVKWVERIGGVPLLSSLMPPTLGNAGLIGFQHASFAQNQYYHNKLRACDHSDYLVDYRTIKYEWLPFLLPQLGFRELCIKALSDNDARLAFNEIFNRDINRNAELLYYKSRKFSVEVWAAAIRKLALKAGSSLDLSALDLIDYVSRTLFERA